MKYTPRDVFKYINIIESKFSLLESDLIGVFYWQQVRHEIFRDLCYKLKVYNTKNSSDNFSQKKSGNGTGILAFFDSIIKFLWKVKQSDTVIINSGRFRKVNGQLLDVYTYPMIQSLRDKGLCFFEISLNSFNFVSTENAIDTRWAKYIANAMKPFIYLFIKMFNSDVFDAISNCVKLEAGLELKDFLYKRTASLKANFIIYKFILKIIKPKRIVLTCSYGKGYLIGAAKSLDIDVVELQHGVIEDSNVGYSFPGHKSLEYFPDRIYLWSDYWNCCDFPILRENIRVCGYLHLEREVIKRRTLTKDKDYMVILSQHVLTEAIAEKFLCEKERFSSFMVYYKLHPQEYNNWGECPSLELISKMANVRIITDDIDMYDLLSKCIYQVGVYSAAIYEGEAFGCNTILFDLPGIEYMDRFIKTRSVEII